MEKLLFTGSSGFLGQNVKPLLLDKYDISTVGRSEECDYIVDLSMDEPRFKESFDVVFHAAGKAHVIPKNQNEEDEFFLVNLTGTKNLCKSLEKIGVPKNFIYVSSVAVYGCESGSDIDESYPLKGKAPYALSKIKTEKFLQSWCEKNNVCLSILRPSLIAGPNAPGNLGSMVNGIKKGKYLSIAGGKARKSVLMVQDIAKLVSLLEDKGGIYNVCDNTQPSFRELEQVICKQLDKKLPFSIPLYIAKFLALIGDLLGSKAPINSKRLLKITESLTFSNKKACKELGWCPLNVLENYRIK